MQELAKVVLLLHSDGLGKFVHLLVEEGICDVLHITVEVCDAILGKGIARQHGTLVA